MRENIRDIINNYIKKVDIYIEENEGRCEFDDLKTIVNKLFEELKEALYKDYIIRNYQYRERIIHLKIMYNLLDELGVRNSKEMFKDDSVGSYKADVKTRLFMMFVKAVGEIVFLLEGGYSACAMSRVRYIYEIGVILEFINNNNNEFAKDFFFLSEKSRINLARELRDKKLINRITKRTNGEISYDKYIRNYGWAKDIIKNDKLSFKELAHLSKYKDKYPIYIESCWYVHADIYGSLFSLDRPKGELINTWNTEPSKYGTDRVITYVFYMIVNIINDYFSDVGLTLHTISLVCSKIIIEKI